MENQNNLGASNEQTNARAVKKKTGRIIVWIILAAIATVCTIGYIRDLNQRRENERIGKNIQEKAEKGAKELKETLRNLPR